MRPVLRLTESRNRTEPSISVPENQEPKKNRNSRFRFGSTSVLSFFGSVLGSRFYLPRAGVDYGSYGFTSGGQYFHTLYCHTTCQLELLAAGSGATFLA